MENVQLTLSKILENSRSIDRMQVKRVLILQDQKSAYIGDSCIWFGRIKHVSAFFNNAAVDINFPNENNHKYIGAFLKNHPYLSDISTCAMDKVCFEDYDLVIVISYDEEKVLQFFHSKYGEAVNDGRFKLAVFSLSQSVLLRVDYGKYTFPAYDQLIEYANPLLNELYISDEEQQWGDEWLRSKGLQEGDELFIVLDSSSKSEKLIRMNVYFEFLSWILKRNNARVLIFDEGNIGKEAFYREWVGEANLNKIIFSKGLTLRQDLCLIGSSYTKMVFGPCTGLLHCASAIVNNYINKGMPVANAPLMVVYTGQYGGLELNADRWWGTSPLVHCLMLKKRNGVKQLCTLNSLSQKEKELNNSLYCSEYTSAALIEFVSNKLRAMSRVHGGSAVVN
jgi:hypothetical protein